MKNLGQMMKQAQEMQGKMAEMQERLAEQEITGAAAGGMVQVTLNGKAEMRAVKIDPSLANPDEIEVLEDLYGSVAYKTHLAQVFTARAVNAALSAAG